MSAKDWSGGVAMSELLMRVNRVASKMGPLIKSPDSRVSLTFQERSFRHYQTLGCLDPGERQGRRVVYGIRHFIQALLIRRLLLEKLSADQICDALRERTTQEIRKAFLCGIGVLTPDERQMRELWEEETEQVWTRLRLSRGIELNLCHSQLALSKAGISRLVAQIRKVVEEHVRP